MFRGVLGVAGKQRRSERRLTAVMEATRRNVNQRWTHRVCEASLEKQKPFRMREGDQRERCHTFVERTRRNHFARADRVLSQKRSWTPPEDNTGAYEFSKTNNTAYQTPPSSSTRLDYDSVDPHDGYSVVQRRFDRLVHDALLKYGPPLPAEFVEENDVVMPHSTLNGSFSSSWSDNRTEANPSQFFDEVQMKPHEIFQIIRQEDPSFSVRGHADGVPFSLLIKNSLYFRAWGGKVHFMRCLSRIQSSTVDGSGKVTVKLSKYKMRELPSFDGLRQGPQPWLYNYRMV